MRDLTGHTALATALASQDGVTYRVKGKIYRNRGLVNGVLATALQSSYPPAGIPPSGLKVGPIQQSDLSMTSVDWNQTSGGVTAYLHYFANDDYLITALHFGSTSEVSTGSYCHYQRPALKMPYLFYIANNGHLFRAELNPTTLAYVASEDCGGFIDNGMGAVHAISTERAVVLWIYEGGVKVADYQKVNGSWTVNTWARRFMAPNKIFEAVADTYRVTFSAAAVRNDDLYVYLSMPDGTVRGVIHQSTGGWSDTFQVIPSDLSEFLVTSALTDANGRVHLCGTFRRHLEDYGTTSFYPRNKTLVCWSDNGKYFTLDRFVEVFESDTFYPFQMAKASDGLYLAEANRTIKLDMFHSMFGESALLLELPGEDFVSMGGNIGDTWQLQLANGDDKYTDLVGNFADGNLAILQLGAVISTDPFEDTIEYERCLIVGIGEDDIANTFVVYLQQEGVARLTQQTYPYYIELNSKQSFFDDCDQMDNLYPAPGAHGIAEVFWTDFWGNESSYNNGGWGPRQLQAGAAPDTFWSSDIMEHQGLATYPTIDAFPITLQLIGWVRNGRIPDALPAESSQLTAPLADGAATGVAPVAVEFMISVEHPDGSKADITVGNPYYSTAPYWNQSYPDRVGGVSPVELVVHTDDAEVLGLKIGDKIIKAGMKVNPPASGWNTYLPIAVAIPEVSMYIGKVGSVDPTWEVESHTIGYDPVENGVTRDVLKIARLGVGTVFFANKPYTAFNFDAAFEYIAEGEAVGYVGAGVVCFGTDANNCIIARLKQGAIQLVKIENGREKILYSVSAGGIGPSGATRKVVCSHRDGSFYFYQCYYWNGYAGLDWYGQATSRYEWKAADGPLSTSKDLFHIGVWTQITVPGVRINSFDSTKSTVIGLATGVPYTAMQNFPSSGKLEIDGIHYNYTGRKMGITNGGWSNGVQRQTGAPFQALGSGSAAKYTADRGSLGGGQQLEGNFIDVGTFWWYGPGASDGGGNASNWQVDTDMVLTSDAGYGYLIRYEDFQVSAKPGTNNNYYLDRTRYFLDGMAGNAALSVSKSDRIYVTLGFTGVSLASGDSMLHVQNSYAFLNTETWIHPLRFKASNGEPETTVGDMVNMVCAMAGVRASFPGDKFYATLASGADVRLEPLGSGLYSYGDGGGFELDFEMPVGWMGNTSNVFTILGDSSIKPGINGFILKIEYDAQWSDWWVRFLQIDGVTKIDEWELNGITAAAIGRVVFHDSYVSLFFDDCCVYTFGIPTAVHYANGRVNLSLSGGGSFANVYMRELSDWREAIFIDLDTTAMNAVQSIIQQRPVEINGRYDGTVSFAYFPQNRGQVTLDFLRVSNRTKQHSNAVASDGIVYYAETAMIFDKDVASEVGFVTRVLRTPELTYGALRAASIQLRMARQAQGSHTYTGRFNPALEVGDLAIINTTRPGTGRTISRQAIVEQIQFQLRVGTAEFSIRGRDNV